MEHGGGLLWVMWRYQMFSDYPWLFVVVVVELSYLVPVLVTPWL